VQTIKFTAIVLVRSFSDTSRLKRKPLPFQMNTDKNLSENGMNLDDDVLYNFTNASSQLMRDDGITPWRGPREKHPLFYQILIDVFSKSEGIVADLTVATGIKHFIFALIFFEIIYSLQTKMLSFVVILITVYYMFDRALHTCLPRFEMSPFGIGR
jgi:hypothetical protein